MSPEGIREAGSGSGGDKLEQNCISFFTQAHLRYIMIKAIELPDFSSKQRSGAFV